jgi:hypothetical protein
LAILSIFFKIFKFSKANKLHIFIKLIINLYINS